MPRIIYKVISLILNKQMIEKELTFPNMLLFYLFTWLSNFLNDKMIL